MDQEYLSIRLEKPSPISGVNLMTTCAGFEMGFHSHDFYHVNRVTHGMLTVYIDGKSYNVEPGCIVVLPPHMEHRLHSEQGHTQIGVDVAVCAAGENAFFDMEEICNGFLIKRIPDYALRADESVVRMRNLLSNPTKVNMLRTLNLAQSQLLDVVEALINDNAEGFSVQFAAMLSKYEPWRLRLSDMCRILCISRTQLERHARYAFGCGASEYCARLRYSKVCELLKSDMTLDRIAEKTGFCDSCHLSKFFSARAKMTPGEYRRTVK